MVALTRTDELADEPNGCRHLSGGPTRDVVRTTHVGPSQNAAGSRGANLAESLIAKLRGRNPPASCSKATTLPSRNRMVPGLSRWIGADASVIALPTSATLSKHELSKLKKDSVSIALWWSVGVTELGFYLPCGQPLALQNPPSKGLVPKIFTREIALKKMPRRQPHFNGPTSPASTDLSPPPPVCRVCAGGQRQRRQGKARRRRHPRPGRPRPIWLYGCRCRGETG